MHFTLPTAIFLAISALEAVALPKAATPMAKRFTSGQCGVHVTQYQKNEGPGDKSVYRLDITIKDAIGAIIGGVKTADAPDNASVDVDSQLPDVFVATVGYIDSDPIHFGYAGQNFESSTGQCRQGAYDSGSRNIDCGFSC